jgi:hypothetical protein
MADSCTSNSRASSIVTIELNTYGAGDLVGHSHLSLIEYDSFNGPRMRRHYDPSSTDLTEKPISLFTCDPTWGNNNDLTEMSLLKNAPSSFAEGEVIMLKAPNTNVPLQRRDKPWIEWYTGLNELEIRVGAEMSPDTPMKNVETAYASIKEQQIHPEAARTAEALLEHTAAQHATIVEVFEQFQEDFEHWPKALFAADLKDATSDGDKMACYFSMIAALSLSQQSGCAHLARDLPSLERLAFGNLLRRCREIQRLCLRDVGKGLFKPAQTQTIIVRK